MRWIYISPHLDDAVLSAGGRIYDQSRAGERVEIWTLNCGFPPEGDLSPLAQVLHFQWGFSSAEETVRLRRAEDAKATARVGAQAVHFDFLDCIYRRGADGEPLYPMDIFAAPHTSEAGLPARIGAALAQRLEADDALVCPLGVGGHVDHVLARKAVEGLNRPLWYYADVPYLLSHPEALGPLTNGARPEVQKVSSAGLSAWVDGIAAYASQLSTLFENPEKWREAIEKYAREGFCLWKFE